MGRRTVITIKLPHHVEMFLEMLAAERGAAANTLEGYRRDLSDFAAFMAKKDRHVQEIGRAHV